MQEDKLGKLIPGVYSLFSKGDHKIDPSNISLVLSQIETILRDYLETKKTLVNKPTLRLSTIGTKNRKLWFEWNTPVTVPLVEDGEEEVSDGPVFMRFLMGSLLEVILLFLVREAGFKVEGEQQNVELDGVPGHPDCFIEGALVDVKTASPYAFDKFSKGKLLQGGDDYGYLYQLAAYKEATGHTGKAYFLGFNKSSGALALLEVPDISLPCARDRVEEVKQVVKLPSPPEEKCWPDKEQKNGNRTLHANCTYCPYKFRCWKESNDGNGLRVFKYSRGPEFFTHINKLPEVEEITGNV